MSKSSPVNAFIQLCASNARSTWRRDRQRYSALVGRVCTGTVVQVDVLRDSLVKAGRLPREIFVQDSSTFKRGKGAKS